MEPNNREEEKYPSQLTLSGSLSKRKMLSLRRFWASMNIWSQEKPEGALSPLTTSCQEQTEFSFCPIPHGSPCLSYRQDCAPSELLCKPFPQNGQGPLWRWGEALLLLHTHTRNEETAENYGQMAIVCSHCSLPSTLGTHILVWEKKIWMKHIWVMINDKE